MPSLPRPPHSFLGLESWLCFCFYFSAWAVLAGGAWRTTSRTRQAITASRLTSLPRHVAPLSAGVCMRTGAALGMGPEATESDAAETSCLAAALGMGSEATESDAVVVSLSTRRARHGLSMPPCATHPPCAALHAYRSAVRHAHHNGDATPRLAV